VAVTEKPFFLQMATAVITAWFAIESGRYDRLGSSAALAKLRQQQLANRRSALPIIFVTFLVLGLVN
jgi:hypothetical protein